ncbi:MAG TPA: helix-hairpin-helix domain-containing protein [Saprospiraceae bacterium]|nr:helix-hairpin-helix domain-containing protein [Saprospiraceae bacterium]
MLLGAFFIGLWLGWILWGKLKQELDRLKVDNQSLNVTLDTLRLEMESFKTRATVAESDNSSLSTQVVNLNREITSLKERAAYLDNELTLTQQRNRQVETELGLSFNPDTPLADNLPLEIQELATPKPLVEPTEGITFESFLPPAEPQPEQNEPASEIALEVELPLVETPTPEMSAPPVFQIEPIVVPETKPTRASKQKNTVVASDPEANSDTQESDDLTVVEGIGPKIQMLLNQYGIRTYRQLADADVARLKEILTTAGPQLAMHDPGTWPSQANLAANDQWDTLKSVQGFLKGGKKPD